MNHCVFIHQWSFPGETTSTRGRFLSSFDTHEEVGGTSSRHSTRLLRSTPHIASCAFLYATMASLSAHSARNTPLVVFHALLAVLSFWWCTNAVAYLVTMFTHGYVSMLYMGLESLFTFAGAAALCVMFALLGGVFNPVLNNALYYYLNTLLIQQLLAGGLFVLSAGWHWRMHALTTLKGLSSLVVAPTLFFAYYRIMHSAQRERAYQAELARQSGYLR